MQKALLVVLTGALCVEGGVSDLPQIIHVPVGFRSFFEQLVEQTHCGLCSSMQIVTLLELLRRLLPSKTVERFLYISGALSPNRNKPYPHRGELLKRILGSPGPCRILWNQSIVVLELDPLQWPLTRVLQPSILVRDDIDPLRLELPYYVQKELTVTGIPYIRKAN